MGPRPRLSSDTGRGFLEVITGCMFSGKTTMLLGLFNCARPDGRILIKPALDTRRKALVATHDGTAEAAITVASSEEIFARKEPYLFIDEGQFFDLGLSKVCARLADEGRIVRVAGLDKDSTGAGFGPMPFLMLEADILQKLWTNCALCKAPFASKTIRKIAQPGQIAVGGAELYEPRCRRCFSR